MTYIEVNIMVDVDKDKPSTFINVVDKEMHDSILKLYQKLKGIKSEIEVKLNILDPHADNTQKENLLSLDEEVDRALDSIDLIVNLVISDEFEEENRENIESLRAIFDENIEKIIKLRDEL